jgi:hypothetical protein
MRSNSSDFSLQSPLRPQGRPHLSAAPWAAPEQDWSAVWKAADSEAERELLLAAWQERKPERLLHFLRVLPPLSIPNQRQLEESALLEWGAREPVPAFEFACRHEGEYHAAERLLRQWLDTDLDTGLQLLTSRLLPETIAPGDAASLAWVLKDPAKVCASLITMRNSSPPDDSPEFSSNVFRHPSPGFRTDDQRTAFVRAAFQVWAGHDLKMCDRLIASLRGKDAAAGLRGISDSLPVPEAARLLESFSRPQITELAAPALARRWAESDFASALKWSVNNLPPAAGDACLDTLSQCLRGALPDDDAVLKKSLTSVPWWAWERILQTAGLNPKITLRLLKAANDDTIDDGLIRKLAHRIGYKPEAPPSWADQLPPAMVERIARVW